MDAAQWPKALVYDFQKEIGLVEEGSGDIGVSNSSSLHSKQGKNNKKTSKPNKDQLVLNCPRCHSTNTKFCYYNNYNPSQPRYLCKACRRYWTHGGTLRNVPVGGSSRKKNKSLLIPPSQSNNNRLFLDLNPKPTTISSNFLAPLLHTRSLTHDNNQDLNMGLYYANTHHFLPIPSLPYEQSASHGALSPNHVTIPDWNTRTNPSPSGFHFQDTVRPTLNLCINGGFGTLDKNNMNEGSGSRVIPYPFGELRQFSAASSAENFSDRTDGQMKDSSNGVLYWNNINNNNNEGVYN